MRVLQFALKVKIGKILCKKCPYCHATKNGHNLTGECHLFLEGDGEYFPTPISMNDNGDAWRCKACLDCEVK